MRFCSTSALAARGSRPSRSPPSDALCASCATDCAERRLGLWKLRFCIGSCARHVMEPTRAHRTEHWRANLPDSIRCANVASARTRACASCGACTCPNAPCALDPLSSNPSIRTSIQGVNRSSMSSFARAHQKAGCHIDKFQTLLYIARTLWHLGLPISQPGS